MKKMNKKGAFGLDGLDNVAITFLIIGVVFAISLIILASFQANTTVSSNTAANAAIAKTVTAVSEIPNNWLGLIAIIIAAVIILGLVMMIAGRGEGR
jgi:ABC-type dipeptide/oligopeptide/nickel transport system permease component